MVGIIFTFVSLSLLYHFPFHFPGVSAAGGDATGGESEKTTRAF